MQTLFSIGYRPFFLLAIFYAMVQMTIWLLFLNGITFAPISIPFMWHGRAMLYGYLGAIFAGFLLTAAAVWADQRPISGRRLMFLVGIWLGARIGDWLAPASIVAPSLDLLFGASLIGVLLPLMLSSKRRVANLAILLFVAVFFAGSMLSFRGMSTANVPLARGGLHMSLGASLLVLVTMLGRLLPYFTTKALGTSVTFPRWIGRAAIVGAFAYNCVITIRPKSSLTAVSLIVSAVAVGAPLLWLWRPKILRNPLLLVLYAGYGWLTIGCLLSGTSFWTGWSQQVAVHALTAGGIGVTTYGMMLRVSLGHSGRPLQSNLHANLGFILINLAAVCRLCGEWRAEWLSVSAALWILAFAILMKEVWFLLTQARQA